MCRIEKNKLSYGAKATSMVVWVIVLLIFLTIALILFYVGGIKLFREIIIKYLFNG